MHIPKHRFKENILLFNLGDVHRGDPAHNNGLFLAAIEEIAATSNAYWVSTGDLLNVALKNSKSDVYHSMNLKDEMRLIKEELSIISEKCLGLVSSNHHRRFDRETGLSLDELLADRLKIPFLGDLGLINVICGKAAYYIALHHGTGGGKRRGAKTNNTEDLAVILPGADIYMEGHTHSTDFFIDETTYIDRKRGKLSSAKSYFCVTGHFMNYYKSYAAAHKFRPMPQGCAVLELFGAGAGNISYKKVKFDLFC